MSIFSKLFDSNEKQIKKLEPLVSKINEYYLGFEKLENKDFALKTKDWQNAFSKMSESEQKVFLENILPEAYALVKEAVRRKLGQVAHDVQLIAAICLHQGKIAEQKTGEGKTLTAVFPLFLNSLTKRGCHLVTPNDYLSKIGCGWMGPVYELLGVKVSTIVHDRAFTFDSNFKDESAQDSRLVNMRQIERQEAYQCDITYGTNNEFGFDYLRDNMVWDVKQMVQTNPKGDWGRHYFSIVDEVDFILIDEARTPLIISAPESESTQKYYEFARIIPKLKEGEDFETDEKTKNATLTEEGVLKLEKILHVNNLYEKDFETIHHIEQALRGQVMYQKDKDYIVKDGEVVIVDEFTGRLMEGRRYSEGLHQAIEAKENVEIKRESKTLATISFQNYFRMYEKLAGMTGTAITEAEEFFKIYGLEVIMIPTDEEVIRKDKGDLIYKTEVEKWKAVMEEVKERHQTGQPILVGTTSIVKNEYLSALLDRKGIDHALLNAKHHEKEALILSEAGEKGSVTVATNMAGRGVDIELGGRKPDQFTLDRSNEEAVKEFEEKIKVWQEKHDEVLRLGGLYVIGTERHEARRIDNQLRGRGGRQGDPGESRFYVSLEDDLMRIFGGGQVKKIMEMLNFPDDLPLEHKMVSKTLEKSQTRVEGHNFDIRKRLVDYDDVMNKQREIIYELRRKVLESMNEEEGRGKLKADIMELIKAEIGGIVNFNTKDEGFDFEKIVKDFVLILPFNESSRKQIKREIEGLRLLSDVESKLIKIAEDVYQKRESDLGEEAVRGIERFVMLSTIDNFWQRHLTDIDHLRQGVGLRGYGQRDPLIEYKSEAFSMFESLVQSINREVVERVYKVTVARQVKRPENVKEKHESVNVVAEAVNKNLKSPAKQVDQMRQSHEPVKVGDKVGRNDPCPCGSGKKYKKCFLAEDSDCKLKR